jgi:hypothetical protein
MMASEKNRKRLFLSFPLRRESSLFKAILDSRLRGSDEVGEVLRVHPISSWSDSLAAEEAQQRS